MVIEDGVVIVEVFFLLLFIDVVFLVKFFCVY